MPQIPSSPLASLFPALSGASALSEVGEDSANPLNFLLLLTQEMSTEPTLPALQAKPAGVAQELIPTTGITAESTDPAVLTPILAEVAETLTPVQALPVGGKGLPVQRESAPTLLQARAIVLPEDSPLVTRDSVMANRSEIRDTTPPLLNPTRNVAQSPVTQVHAPPAVVQFVERLAGERRPASAPVETIAFAPATSASASLASPTPTSATPAPAMLEIHQNVGEAGWDRALGQKLAFMAENGVTRAEIRLHPQHLGPLEVHVRVANDEVSIAFQAQHATTRDALESALPRLRELFDQQGLNLAQADVSQHSGKGPGTGPQDDSGDADGEAFSLDGDKTAEDGGPGQSVNIAIRGLVDAYA